MRLCIPTQTNIGHQAEVHAHFGSAPYFTIYDIQQDICEIVDNSNQHHWHGACHPFAVLEGKKINAVVCPGMGKRAIQRLNEAGIRVYRASGANVKQIVKEYRIGDLHEVTATDACSHHGCHH